MRSDVVEVPPVLHDDFVSWKRIIEDFFGELEAPASAISLLEGPIIL
jgi:hypothetical protein